MSVGQAGVAAGPVALAYAVVVVTVVVVWLAFGLGAVVAAVVAGLG